VFGCFAMFYIFYQIWSEGVKRASFLNNRVRNDQGVGTIRSSYMILAGLLTFVWMLYPICWALCEGGNVISSDSEAVFYGILDFIAKPIFSFLLLWRHSSEWELTRTFVTMLTCTDLDNDDLCLGMRDYDVMPPKSAPTGEKLGLPHHGDNLAVTNFGSGTNTNVNSPVTGTAAAYEGEQFVHQTA